MSMCEPFVSELNSEAAATERLLSCVPADRLDWKPHQKSMSLGQLAFHVATIPGNVAEIAGQDLMEVPEFGNFPSPETAAELLPALEGSCAKAKGFLGGLDDEAAMGTWKMVRGDEELMAVPRIGLLRSIMLNHWYHHRGQLTVYLRMLDVPLPPTYGPTADVNPFAQPQ